jgi:hypothetical protein
MHKRGRVNGRDATFSDYERLFATEHLNKFSGPEVGFRYRSQDSHECGKCIHWFVNPYSQWTPCEIMSLGQAAKVPSEGVCRFWNQNGKDFPLLEAL